MQDRFVDEPERYNRLFNVFSDYCANVTSNVPYEARVSKVRVEVRDILEGHDDLIEGFESFMPKDLEKNEEEAA